MRKNFAQVLESAEIDLKKEYTKLFTMLYATYKDGANGTTSVYEKFSDAFPQMWFRGTAITLDEFDEEHGFCFEAKPENLNIDYFISFCEYFYNLCVGYQDVMSFLSDVNTTFITQQIKKIISLIGYKSIKQNDLTIFIEKSPSAIAVSEIIDDKNLSYKTIYYNHHSMKGDIEGKKEIILKLANCLEAKRKVLHSVNSTLADDLFFIFNNLNIRHNNTDSSDMKNYRKPVDDMPTDELEQWYDETYQMCLLAFLEIENIERKKKVADLKKELEKTI